MNKLDVLELLDDIENTYNEILKQQQTGLTNEDIKSLPSVKLKNISENLRSCLDYLAFDIFSTLSLSGNPKDIYFPYGTDIGLLRKIKRNSWIKNLEVVNKALYDIIIDNQDFSLPKDEQWLVQLCQLTIKVKHNNLERPERKDSGRMLHTDRLFKLAENVTIEMNDCRIRFPGDQEFTNIKNFKFNSSEPAKVINERLNEAGIKFPTTVQFESVEFVTNDGLDVIKLLGNAILKTKKKLMIYTKSLKDRHKLFCDNHLA